MAFNFGGTNTAAPSLGFGAAAKPAFGNSSFSFGAGAATTSAPGGFGFGTAPATTNTGFGGFGAPAVSSAAPTGFGGFGAPQATSAPSLFGAGGFGAPATTTSAFTGFGTNTTGAFGATGATGFGAPASTAFGAPNTGFGATNTGFGATAGFGVQNTAFGSTAPAFGATNTGFGAPASSFGTSFGAGGTGFGAGTAGFGTTGGFGSAFGSKPLGMGTNTGFGGFGAGLGTSFGQPQQQAQQQPQVASPNEALVNAVYNCSIFGDERDQILAKWNFLQAKWGVGKAYYSNSQPPIELNEQNPLCRFKAIGYSCLPSSADKDGLVQLVFGKSEQELKTQQAQLQTSMNALFGNKPNLTITIDSIKAISETKAQAMIFVTEKSATNSAGTRVAAAEVATFLGGPIQRQQLAQLGGSPAQAHSRPDARHLQDYLESPPPGIDVRLWKQAQADNPDPEKYIPVPMIGFSEVKWRMRCQEEETKLHSAFLSRAAGELQDLRARHAAAQAAMQDQRRRYMHLHHRLLVGVVRQESARRAGAALTTEEEALRGRLEALHAQLSAPTQFNGRLSELLSQMRMQRCQAASQSLERYSMDLGSQDDIKQFLAMQHKGIMHLVETVHKDMAHLELIREGMTGIIHGNE